jgi:hypothetical protein
MKLTSVEQLWSVYPNKYLALNVAALEARRLIDAIQRGEAQLDEDPYHRALDRCARAELKHAKLTEEELAALGREGLEEPAFRPV